ncbi:rhodanese-like domain-containing protein [Pelagibius sp. Alg239-R121]|uniref:rhodanese-like domain-containing protein n=1 Tax=Pelagibius sp. Alg239-R121 TaxID=2993448 RepID=UPI0024A72E0C|nr:rhodanese-like domain-containing protein [Pelagibius sp. Alg239-R121]
MKNILTKFLFAVAILVAPAAANAAFVAPDTIEGTTMVSPEEAKALYDRGVPFVDVRGDADFDGGRVPGAYHMPLKSNFSEETLVAELGGKDKEMVVYCNGVKCGLSAKACEQAVAWGFTKVYYFREGYPGWNDAGYPVE